MEKYKLFIDGEFVDSSSGEYLDVISPIDQEVIGQVSSANKEDVDRAVKSALLAFPEWKETSYEERFKHAQKFIEYLEEHKEEIAETITKELGAPIEFSRKVQVNSDIEGLREMLELAKDYKFVEEREGYELHKDPVGVVACITPWNYPLSQITKKIIPALLMGNVTILKPSSQTPITAVWAAKAIEYAGYPKGTFSLLTGIGSEMGDLLSEHPDINMVTFTGSTEVGKNVAGIAAERMKRVAMELGGKSASIVMKGADLDQALDKTVDIVCMNSGQTCSALTRLFIPEDMKNEIEEMVIEKAKAYTSGDPFGSEHKMGPVQSKDQFEKISKYVKIGLDEGAKIIFGEEPKDLYVNPIVFTDVKNDMTIAQEEIFGPVLSIITYKDIDEAVEMANDSLYGLSGAVYGPEEEADKVARKLRTGNVYVNSKGGASNVPFGGFKYSGIGRENGLEGLEEFVELKALIKVK